MTPLIDATEMYLRTVWELEEEGITPIRARLVERLSLSAPAVSETVSRLEHDGLLRVTDERRLELTDDGRKLALNVMRKHRLVERLLVDVIGLDWEHVHNEACRWEHVVSDAVVARLITLLDDPDTCPFGNPIPRPGDSGPAPSLITLAAAAKRAGGKGGRAQIMRISEQLQVDVNTMRFLHDQGLNPGVVAHLAIDNGAIVAAVDGGAVNVPASAADLIYVALI